MPNCTASFAASQSPNPHCSSLRLRFGSIGATKSTAHLNPKMSNLFLADPQINDQGRMGANPHDNFELYRDQSPVTSYLDMQREIA